MSFQLDEKGIVTGAEVVSGRVNADGTLEPSNKALNRPPELTKEETATLQTGFVSPEKSVEIAQICLKHRLPKDHVIALLGKPNVMDGAKATYNLAPSQWLDIHFDATGDVVRVEMSGKPIPP